MPGDFKAFALLHEFSEFSFGEILLYYWPFSEKMTASGADRALLENSEGISSRKMISWIGQ